MKLTACMTIALMTAVTALTACDGNDGEPTTEVTSYDIVCLASVDKTGSSYTLTKPLGSELITYRSHEIMDTTRIKVGSRFMLAYRPADGKPYVSGIIKPLGYSPVTNDTLRRGYISKIDGWDQDPVYLLSNWMSQDYLNLRARLPYDTRARALGVMVDSLTLNAEYPDCYLIHRLESPVNTFDRSYYMSFDMSWLRKLDNCRGFNLILNNSNLKTDRFRYELKTKN